MSIILATKDYFTARSHKSVVSYTQAGAAYNKMDFITPAQTICNSIDPSTSSIILARDELGLSPSLMSSLSAL